MRVSYPSHAVAVAVGVCITLMGLFGPASASDIKVGTWKTAQTIQPFFYRDFLSPKDRVEVFSFTNPSDQRMALVAGSLDMCGTTLAHAIAVASRGEPVVVVAALCNKCSALVVKKDAGITKVEDLKGKRIGYVPGTMHEILLRETLTRAGINPDKDVSLTRVDFFDMGSALAGGGIEAFLSGEPFPTMAVQAGYGKILAYPYYDESIGSINAGMLVREDTVRKDPELVLKLVRAHAKATERLKANPDLWLKRASQFGVPLSILEKASSNMQLAWQMDEAFVRKARALGKRMQELGVIKKQPDFASLFNLDFVRKVRLNDLR